MHEYDDRLARAYETLEQANRTLQQQRDPVDVEPIANWHGCTTTAAMNTGQFDAWCRAGKPPLVAPTPDLRSSTLTRSQVDNMIRSAVDQERANLQASFEAAAAIIGDEAGKADAKLAEQIRQLRIELVELRAELHDMHGERSTDAIVDLPNWRSDVVQH